MVKLYRKAGVEAVAERALPKKESARRLRQGQMVESLVLLSALGAGIQHRSDGAKYRHSDRQKIQIKDVVV